MKKIFASILAVAMSMSMFASITSNIRLTLISESENEAYVELRTGSDYNPFDPTNCSTYFGNLSNTKNIGMYAIYEGSNYSNLAASELVNIPLVVVTSREAAAKQNYWLYVDVYGGAAQNSETLTITDLRATGGPKTVELTGSLPNEGLALEFSLDEETAYTEGANSIIADRFVINYDPSVVISLTTNEEGWASFAHDVNVVPVDNSLKMYKGAINGEVLSLTEVGYVKAGEGVVVKGAANTTYDFKKGEAYGNFSSNDLIGCPVATAVLAGTNFVLSYKNGATAFYEYTGSEIPAHKAYLNFPASTPAPQRIRMVINQEQAIENVTLENVKTEKFVENGQIYIRRGNEVFNLQGQIVK